MKNLLKILLTASVVLGMATNLNASGRTLVLDHLGQGRVVALTIRDDAEEILAQSITTHMGQVTDIHKLSIDSDGYTVGWSDGAEGLDAYTVEVPIEVRVDLADKQRYNGIGILSCDLNISWTKARMIVNGSGFSSYMTCRSSAPVYTKNQYERFDMLAVNMSIADISIETDYRYDPDLAPLIAFNCYKKTPRGARRMTTCYVPRGRRIPYNPDLRPHGRSNNSDLRPR